MKKTLLFMLAAVLALALGACGTKTDEAKDDDLSYIQDKGTLVIGITEYEPINYYDENQKLIGFDTEFAEALCAKWGLTPEFVIINWDTKETELNAKNIDCIWNGLTVTEERRENMGFSEPYLRNEQVVVVRAADAGKYTDAASLAGAKIVAEAESAGESTVAAYADGAEYTAVPSQASALLEIKAGTADAAVIDSTMAEAMTGAGTDYEDLTIVKSIDFTDEDEEYAIGFRLGSTAVAKVDELIAELRSDGTLDGIAEKYSLADRLVK
jgi:polar amino acid transport system substrate-binding protein